MFSKLFTPEAHGTFQLPIGTYYIARTVRLLRRAFIWLSKLETRRLERRVERSEIDRPIYITGIARGGTTITLEMLSKHPDVGTHRYFLIPNPYIPHWWERFVDKLPLDSSAPIERLHKDGIMVTKDSPEALEEPLWETFFKGLHDESRSNVLGADTSNPKFERFYRDHIWKLLVNQERSRYVAKCNYSVTRMEYLSRLFPDAVFIMVIRNPINHLASYAKQNTLFEGIQSESRRTIKLTQMMGHYEFGPRRLCINVGDDEVIPRVREMWAEGQMMKGFATYWASVYDFVADSLDSNPDLRRRTFVMRYEDLCGSSSETLDRLIEHTGLSAEAFAPVKEEYVNKLKPPTYYRSKFSDRELQDIVAAVADTAGRFGYLPSEGDEVFSVTGERPFDLTAA